MMVDAGWKAMVGLVAFFMIVGLSFATAPSAEAQEEKLPVCIIKSAPETCKVTAIGDGQGEGFVVGGADTVFTLIAFDVTENKEVGRLIDINLREDGEVVATEETATYGIQFWWKIKKCHDYELRWGDVKGSKKPATFLVDASGNAAVQNAEETQKIVEECAQ